MIKKWNWTLTVLAGLNLLFYWLIMNYLMGLSQGMAFIGVFIIPGYAVIFSVIVLIFILVNRKTWFEKGQLFSTLILLIACSPIPLMIGLNASQPTITTMTEESWMSEESSFRSEIDLKKGQPIAIRYWIIYNGKDQPIKDSTWVYFDENGDTSAIEIYKNDTLVLERNYQISADN